MMRRNADTLNSSGTSGTTYVYNNECTYDYRLEHNIILIIKFHVLHVQGCRRVHSEWWKQSIHRESNRTGLHRRYRELEMTHE